MPVPFASKRYPVAAAVLAAAVPMAAAGAAPPALRFEQAFPTAAAPAALHARVAYRTADGVHRAELWRSPRALRRDTDGRLTTIATRRPGDPAFRLDLFDTVRRVHTVIDRDSLYRIGRFTDWDDLAFGLRRPAGRHAIRALGAVTAHVAPAAPCAWYALESDRGTTRICWSRRFAYPMLMLDPAGGTIWRVTALDVRAPAPGVFRFDDTGYVLNDAVKDISND